MNVKEVSRVMLWFAIGLGVIAVASFLLQQQIRQHRDTVTIRSYAVAPEIAGEMRSALNEVLNIPSKDGVSALARVSLTADGRLLVSAPESIQKGVESLLAEVATDKPAPTPTIHFEMWLVSAVPDTATPSDNGPGLAEVGTALADIQKSRGPLHFELTEKLALQARAANQDSEIQGAHFALRVIPTVRPDSKGDPVIAARIDVQMINSQMSGPIFGGFINPGSLKALAEFRPGQLLVIGQSSLPARPGANPSPDTQEYYIVRASL
jgi:hypothetical protein